jgi:inner membrane protein
MSGIFTQSPANRRRYGVSVFVGIVAGIISAFVKWGAEHPFFCWIEML